MPARALLSMRKTVSPQAVENFVWGHQEYQQEEAGCRLRRTLPALRSFRDVRGLRSLLALDYLEFNLIAFLQALVSFGRDRAVVNEDIRAAIVPSDEPISLRIVEPFHGSLQTFHVPPSFLRLVLETVRISRVPQKCVGIVMPVGGAVKDKHHNSCPFFG